MTRPAASPRSSVGLVEVSGVIDESFEGFGEVEGLRSLVIDVRRMTRMSSFGVRKWLSAIDRLPKSLADVYLLGCPTFFVDQLNMVLGFGGPARILTITAPYVCPECGVESAQTIDVLAERDTLMNGAAPMRDCGSCSAKLEIDESPESYFGFTATYAATNVSPDVARLLEERGLYTVTHGGTEKPPRVIKLVHGSVTYFRVIGAINSLFKARPFLVGAEGEIVIDLGEVDHVDGLALPEWLRLLKTLAGQVPSVTIVDVTESLVALAAGSLRAPKVFVSSLLVPYKCDECSRVARMSHPLSGTAWPPTLKRKICPTCGGRSHPQLSVDALEPLREVATSVPAESAKLIERRTEIISRAVTDANVAKAGESAAVAPGDTILGKYKIVRRLSAGGMADVYLANQIGIGGFEKPVALKRIQRKLLERRHLAIDMFLNEAKIAGRLMHPNIVQVLDVGEVGGALYLAMEYVHGKDLREVTKRLRIASHKMPIGMACHITRELANALHHAFSSKDMEGKQLSVVHRDVTPHNVIVGFDGQIKLLDFGVALSAVTEQEQSMIVGKWSYMSPEHSIGVDIDHRSDLFSLGVVLYLLVTGSLPFPGTVPKEIVAKIREGKFVPLDVAVPGVPAKLSQLVSRMLSPDPKQRPQTGHEVASSLDKIIRDHPSSMAQIAQLVGDLFSEERNVTSTILDDELTERPLAHGSAATLDAGPAADDSYKSPVSFHSQSLSMGSQSQSLRPRAKTPTTDLTEQAPTPSPEPAPLPVTPEPTPPAVGARLPPAPSRRESRVRMVVLVIGLLVLAALAILTLLEP